MLSNALILYCDPLYTSEYFATKHILPYFVHPPKQAQDDQRPSVGEDSVDPAAARWCFSS
jgi:hypothetical protein